MRVTDVVVWHTGMGMGLYGVAALRLGHDQLQRMPRFFKPDDLNIPDVQQRVHWDPEWAQRAGNPACYDYGRMRETWLIHLCTDWMGDDAWLWKLDCQFRKFNYVGDTHRMQGRVTRKYLAEGRSTSRGSRCLGGEPTRRDDDARSCDHPACHPKNTARFGSPSTGRSDHLPRSPRFPSSTLRRRGTAVKPYPEMPPGLTLANVTEKFSTVRFNRPSAATA